MPESRAVSAHGTRIRRNNVTLVGVREVTPPPLLRKSLERTVLADADDTYRVGIRRHGLLQFGLVVVPGGEATQDGLLLAWVTTAVDAYDVEFVDGAVWTFNGIVTEMKPSTPIDGLFTMQVSVQPVGTVLFTSADLLTEADGRLLQETGGRILL